MAFDKVIDSAKLDSALSETANAIREKSGSTELMTFDETHGFKDAVESIDTVSVYEQGFEDGKNSVVQVERYANAIQFASLNLFGKEELTLNLDNATTLNMLCRSQLKENDNTTVKHLTINCLKPITNISNMIFSIEKDYKLERITFNADVSNVTSVTYMLRNLGVLKVIDGTPLDFSSMTSISTTTFANCNGIEEIRFKPNSIFVNLPFSQSAVLSNETIESIIEGLADLTGQTTQSLDLHSEIILKLTDEQWAQISAKNWSAT